MSKKDDLQGLIEILERRLGKLKQIQAAKGINTPAEDLIEIEDIEREIDQHQAELAALAEEEEAGVAQPPLAEPVDVTESVQQTAPPPPSKPIIQPGPGIELTPPIEAVLRLMFTESGRLYVETEFGQGFTNTRVFKVRPIGDRDYLPLVVKVGPERLIQREWETYNQMEVADTMSGIARVEKQPIVLADGDWAGLAYTLAGDAVHKVVSLKQYCQATDQTRLTADLVRFLRRMSERWWLNHRTSHCQLQVEYDLLLPVNLMIEPLSERPDGYIHQLKAGSSLPSNVTHGDAIHLEGFMVTEVEAGASQQQVTLNLPVLTGEPSQDFYRLRLVNGPALERYREGDVIDSLYGRVSATRQELMTRLAAAATSDPLDLSAGRLRLTVESKGVYPVDLPNPLLAYQDILGSFTRLKLSTIHGDLNLENVLVDASNGEMYLIDFAATRQGHVLHDLLHLEQGVVTQLLPENLMAANLPPEAIWVIYEQLHKGMVRPGFKPQLPHPALEKPFAILQAIRKAAGECLATRDNWEEYYQGLIIYFLAALKFKDLDELPTAPRPKRVAFWAAASALALLQSEIAPPIPPVIIENPFRPNGRVSDYMKQLKLGPIVNRCRDLLTGYALHNIAIEGEHGFGKTTLLRFLKQIADQEEWKGPDFKLVFIDLDCSTIDPFEPKYFWRRILEKSQDAVRDNFILKEHLDEALNKSTELDYADFENLYFLLKQHHYALVLLLDEFDTIVRTNTVNPSTIRGFLAKLRSSHDPDCVALVTCTRERLEQVCSDIEQVGSPFYNIFLSMSLPLFSSDEINELLKHVFEETDIELSQVDRTLLGNLAGGNPVLILRTGELIFEQRRHGPLSEHSINAIITSFERKADRYFSLYWDKSSLLEQSLFIGLILSYLANHSFPSLSNKDVEFINHLLQSQKFNLGHLAERGLITAEGGTYRLFSLAFATWIVIKIAAENDSQFMERYRSLDSERLKQIWQAFKELTHPPILGDVLQTLKKGSV